MTNEQRQQIIEEWKEAHRCFTYTSGIVVSVTSDDLTDLCRRVEEAVKAEQHRQAQVEGMAKWIKRTDEQLSAAFSQAGSTAPARHPTAPAE